MAAVVGWHQRATQFCCPIRQSVSESHPANICHSLARNHVGYNSPSKSPLSPPAQFHHHGLSWVEWYWLWPQKWDLHPLIPHWYENCLGIIFDLSQPSKMSQCPQGLSRDGRITYIFNRLWELSRRGWGSMLLCGRYILRPEMYTEHKAAA